MDKVRQRINAVRWLVMTARAFQADHFLITEGVFVQFRKTLELIAFASLSAHRDQYSQAYANYHLHWKAKDMLKAVEKLNPNFYPVPLLPPVKTGPNSWHFPGQVEDALTREDFEKLYDTCGEILHMRNPFSSKDPTTDIGYSVDEWVARIQRLLAWHSVELLDGQRWICSIPAEGAVHVTTGTPRPDESEGSVGV
ncbi:MAG: hypothetical protein ACRD26_04385 [Vicinamibacterales bacterium]